MKHIFVLQIILCIFSFSVQAQQDMAAIKGAAATATRGVGGGRKLPPDSLAWKKGGDISLNFSQVHLENWAAGGEKSISFGSSCNLFANYKKDKMIWENTAFMAYGVIKAEKRNSVKNIDQLTMGSRVGYQMAQKWYYTAALLGRSQLAPGYRYTAKDTTRISDFLAPAYLFLSLGLDYKPSNNFFVSIAPAMGKATFVRSKNEIILASAGILRNDEGQFDRQARYEFGGGVVFNVRGDYFEKRVTYSTQLELFSNYFDKPQNLDVIWDFQFRIALTKFVASTIRLNMLYNDNQKTFVMIDGVREERGPKLQVKQFFEIGLFYAF